MVDEGPYMYAFCDLDVPKIFIWFSAVGRLGVTTGEQTPLPFGT